MNSQTDAIEQMRRGGIEVFLYQHGGISDATEILRQLGTTNRVEQLKPMTGCKTDRSKTAVN